MTSFCSRIPVPKFLFQKSCFEVPVPEFLSQNPCSKQGKSEFVPTTRIWMEELKKPKKQAIFNSEKDVEKTANASVKRRIHDSPESDFKKDH